MPRRNYPKDQHVPLRPQANCDNKRRYKTKAEAEATREYQELVQLGLELRVYACPIPGCGGWHLTQARK